MRLQISMIKKFLNSQQTSSKIIFKTSSRHLAKTSSKRLQNTFKTSCKNIFQASSRRLQDALKTSLTPPQDILKKSCKDVFKMLSRCIFKLNCSLLTHLPKVFNTFLRRTAKTGIYRWICLSHTSEKFMVSAQICKSNKNFSSFSFSVYCTFYWLLTESYLEPGRTSTMELFCKNT